MPLYRLEGHAPDLPPEGEYFVAPGAVLIGKVKLERQASVWFGAVLRGDNEQLTIGENSNVQDACVLHTDMGYPLVIERNVTVGHAAVLHGCVIGEGSLVGIGATVLNGTRVGRNCVIGAHALIGEGKEIPDNSLVLGMPGRVSKTYDADEAEKFAKLAGHYVRNQKRYLADFEEIV